MACYRIARRASSDLEAIWLYIAADSPDHADRFMTRLYDAFLMLAPRALARRVSTLLPNYACFRYVNTSFSTGHSRTV